MHSLLITGNVAATAIVLAVVLLLVAAAVFSIHRERKKGSSACEGCALKSFCRK
ncbi:MAG: FeoB-associated Cys-rich membrane protein [Bacteroidales bacterium]|nr:FeoB-associated Cys-rich membrane protein [Bacteroidales bacterium]